MKKILKYLFRLTLALVIVGSLGLGLWKGADAVSYQWRKTSEAPKDGSLYIGSIPEKDLPKLKGTSILDVDTNVIQFPVRTVRIALYIPDHTSTDTIFEDVMTLLKWGDTKLPRINCLKDLSKAQQNCEYGHVEIFVVRDAEALTHSGGHEQTLWIMSKLFLHQWLIENEIFDMGLTNLDELTQYLKGYEQLGAAQLEKVNRPFNGLAELNY